MNPPMPRTTQAKDRRVGDERFESVAQQVQHNAGRLSTIEGDLGSIKDYIRQMAESMTKLAVIEAHAADDRKHREEMGNELKDLRKELQEFKDSAAQTTLNAAVNHATASTKTKWMERGYWILVNSAVIGSVSYVFTQMGPSA